MNHPRIFLPAYVFSIFVLNCFESTYKRNKYDFVALGYIFVIFITQLAWAISQSPRTRGFPTSARNKFGSCRFISQSLFWFDFGKSKSFRLNNGYSPEREYEFLAQNWNWVKITYIFNIFTYQTIIRQNFEQKFEHLSKYAYLICISPFGISRQNCNRKN